MTMQHGTQPTTKPAKPISDDHKERKRGVKPVLPPRDGTTRTQGVSEAHKAEDKHKIMPKNSPENLGPDALPKSKKNVPTDTYDVDENLREY